MTKTNFQILFMSLTLIQVFFIFFIINDNFNPEIFVKELAKPQFQILFFMLLSHTYYCFFAFLQTPILAIVGSNENMFNVFFVLDKLSDFVLLFGIFNTINIIYFIDYELTINTIILCLNSILVFVNMYFFND